MNLVWAIFHIIFRVCYGHDRIRYGYGCHPIGGFAVGSKIYFFSWPNLECNHHLLLHLDFHLHLNNLNDCSCDLNLMLKELLILFLKLDNLKEKILILLIILFWSDSSLVEAERLSRSVEIFSLSSASFWSSSSWFVLSSTCSSLSISFLFSSSIISCDESLK